MKQGLQSRFSGDDSGTQEPGWSLIMVEVGSTSVRGSVARSLAHRSHDSVNAGSNPAPDFNECSENAIYQEPLDLGLLKEEEDRKKHSSSSTTLKLPRGVHN